MIQLLFYIITDNIRSIIICGACVISKNQSISKNDNTKTLKSDGPKTDPWRPSKYNSFHKLYKESIYFCF